MRLGYSLAFASGRTNRDCHFIGYRFAGDAFRPETGESLVVRATAGGSEVESKLDALIAKPGWLTGLWRSPSGTVYVTDSTGRIYQNPDPRPGSAFAHTRLDGVLAGVWGLDDQHVWAWGQHRMSPVAYRWDGSLWHATEPPGFITAMHGLGPDLLMAVGRDGFVARWDGARWHEMDAGIQATLSGICVVDQDRMYACGPKGNLIEGSIYGWSPVLEHRGVLHCVAHALGELFVGAGPDGLMRFDGKKLVSVKPNIHAETFDWRNGLLISSPAIIAHTGDGERFLGFRADTIADLMTGQKPAWLDDRDYRDPDDRDTD